MPGCYAGVYLTAISDCSDSGSLTCTGALTAFLFSRDQNEEGVAVIPAVTIFRERETNIPSRKGGYEQH
jgi:hypothetical protein